MVRLAYAWLPKFRMAHLVQAATILVPVSLIPRRAVRQHRRGRLHRQCRARDHRQVPLHAGHQPDQSAESQNGLHPRPRDRPRDREDCGVLHAGLLLDPCPARGERRESGGESPERADGSVCWRIIHSNT